MTYAEIIIRIAAALDAADTPIPYTICPCWEGWQLRFPWCEGDVAVHDGTYGARANKVETYRFPWDRDDVSCLTIDEAITRIQIFYNMCKDMRLV